MEQLVNSKIELTELANKLFMYTDAQQWDLLLSEVFTDTVKFDMSSISGQAPQELKASEICEMWKNGFVGIDSVHHQAGHYLITVKENEADIYAYAVATHYKKETTLDNTRSFTGSYNLKALETNKGWRISHFKYNLKFAQGNIELK
jgi:hypothetical protein